MKHGPVNRGLIVIRIVFIVNMVNCIILPISHMFTECVIRVTLRYSVVSRVALVYVKFGKYSNKRWFLFSASVESASRSNLKITGKSARRDLIDFNDLRN